jgi:hypothetical protein
MNMPLTDDGDKRKQSALLTSRRCPRHRSVACSWSRGAIDAANEGIFDNSRAVRCGAARALGVVQLIARSIPGWDCYSARRSAAGVAATVEAMHQPRGSVLGGTSAPSGNKHFWQGLD